MVGDAVTVSVGLALLLVSEKLAAVVTPVAFALTVYAVELAVPLAVAVTEQAPEEFVVQVPAESVALAPVVGAVKVTTLLLMGLP